MWRWFSINIDEDLHFGGIRLGTGQGDLHRGWVFDDGRAASIAEWRLRTEVGDDGLTQRVVHLTALDKKGRSYDLLGEVQRVADIGRTAGTLINEGLTRWTYRDEDGATRTGYGISEYLHQIDDSGRPVVAVDLGGAADRRRRRRQLGHGPGRDGARPAARSPVAPPASPARSTSCASDGTGGP